jgi:hypothetical protein
MYTIIIPNTYLEDIGTSVLSHEVRQHAGNFDIFIVFKLTTDNHRLIKSAT